jgi:hypothetical protein
MQELENEKINKLTVFSLQVQIYSDLSSLQLYASVA